MGNKCDRFCKACEKEDVPTINALFKHVDIDLVLNEACRTGKLSVLRHVRESIVKNRSALYNTIYSGHIECAKFIQECDPTQIYSRTIDGYTPFHACCMQQNRLECAKFVLEHDPSQLSLQTLRGLTPLMFACIYNNLDMVNLIVSLDKVQVFTRSIRGDTPLLLSCYGGTLEFIKGIWELNPDQSDQCNNDGASPLHITALRGNLECLKFIYSTNPNMITNLTLDNKSIFYTCCYNNKLECAKFLLSINPAFTHEFRKIINGINHKNIIVWIKSQVRNLIKCPCCRKYSEKFIRLYCDLPFYTCPICLCPVKTPCTTECGHIFCMSCTKLL